jgi:hypothetical protein
MAKTHSVLSGMPRFAAAVSFVFVFPQFAPPDAPAAVGLGTFGLMGFIFAGATDARNAARETRASRAVGAARNGRAPERESALFGSVFCRTRSTRW